MKDDKNTPFGNLKPMAYIQGDESSGMMIQSMEMSVGGQIIAEYKAPIELSTGKVDDGSRKQGSALFTISTDGKNTVSIKEEGSGRVTNQTKDNFVIEAIGKTQKTENWKAELKVKTQDREPFTYFDLVLIKRNGGVRDHINDPHIAFYPDGAGKYIRYDNTKDIKVENSKITHEINGIIIPIETIISCPEFLVRIQYSFENNILSVANIYLEDSIV